MQILAIETSCDDTAISIIKTPKNNGGCFDVLSNIISSQIEVHKKYGGVYPMLAKREHQKNILSVLVKALEGAKLLKTKNKIPTRAGRQKLNSKIIKDILEREPELYKRIMPFLQKYEKPEIDLIAVTEGPGLEPCLWVGINFAKALSFFWNISIIPVNHIESHILVNFLPNSNHSNNYAYAQTLPLLSRKIFPAVCLIVSGGHTQLILMKGIGKYKILGETRDDAAGECFDKAAKILGLGYPGGPIISKLASCAVIPSLTGNPESIVQTLDSRFRENDKFLPRPMIGTKDYDFSFSGLKTAVLYHHKKQPIKIQKSKNYIAEICFEIQQAIIDVLIKKTIKATKDYKAKTIILGGGVSANQELRKQFKNKINKEIPNTNFLVPETEYSTDNALMTAITGFFHKKERVNPSTNSGRFLRKIKAKPNLRIE